MAKKSALGRGLGALLPVEKEEGKNVVESGLSNDKKRRKKAEEPSVTGIDLSLISPNPFQPRIDFDPHELDELVSSIRQLGVIQPITVRKSGSGFEIISGERRFRASKEVGLARIPAYVREASTQEMIEMAVVENIQRANLNPIEIANGYHRLMEECNLTQEQVAERVGKNRSTVANTLRLLSLCQEVRDALKSGKVSSGHARSLVTLDEKRQKDLLNRIIRRQLSVRDTEALAKVLAGTEPAKTKAQSSASSLSDRDQLEINSLTDKLRSRLATQVKIKHRKSGKGAIEIEYFDVEELSRIIDAITNES